MSHPIVIQSVERLTTQTDTHLRIITKENHSIMENLHSAMVIFNDTVQTYVFAILLLKVVLPIHSYKNKPLKHI